ncbi:YEATS family domain-containing protein [Phthorimaea operculella]|nr:YEATS family domain-containing protein [Phthorimaea operculella]
MDILPNRHTLYHLTHPTRQFLFLHQQHRFDRLFNVLSKKYQEIMSAIKVNFEIGHEASLRSKKTPEGFTHDWEVFVRGQEGHDISHFVDKVVFHLHETFPKPKRVVKEPPFSIKESGYAGFVFPIEIFLKNKDEPKRIQFTYDLSLQQSGVLKDRYIFQNPNDDFRKKLMKGGGLVISNTNAFYTNPDQETRSRDSFSEDKPILGKPKQLTEKIEKKHKSKEHKEEMTHRTSSFENLFGAPIQKPSKISPDPKKMEKTASAVKSDKKDKERSSSDKKPKHEHKESKSEKVKIKEEKDRSKSEKVKSHSKEQEKQKEKSSKRPSERPPSPDVAKKKCPSPSRRPPSPPPRSSSASSIKEEYKPKHNSDSFEIKKPKVEEKPPEIKVDKDVKEKKKKEKKSHDRDKERKEKKEHKKEHKSKESPKEQVKEVPKETPKPRDVLKEKDPVKDSPPVKEKPPKPEKINKFSIENLRKTPPPENEERSERHKKEKSESESKKHKHKKKDKKRDESREKNKESSKEKKHKHEKREEKPEVVERRPTPVPKERPPPEPASPISIDTASQCSSKSGLVKPAHAGAEDIVSSQSDSENSMIAEDEDVKKEKSKKHKDKSSRKEEKRRKRKAAEEENSENRKVAKTEGGPSNDTGETSGSSIMSSETKVQDNGVSSSLGEDAEPGDISPDYMVQLRGLQQRIMMIKNNEELERVVNLIAETGRYEVTTQTFDFDLCLLDRSTVQQLIQLVGC